ncbi:formate dehydrogenase accessory sulfurtransferase FdhD [Candidatus Latescibacterota bacterium]
MNRNLDVDILKIDAVGRRQVSDVVTDESLLTIYLNGRELLTLLCTFTQVKELCAGFLYSAGLIHAMDDIDHIFIDDEKMTAHIGLKNEDLDTDAFFRRVYTSGCGKGILFFNALDIAHQTVIQSDFTIAAESILEVMKLFNKTSDTFKKTGGVHSAALSDGVSLLAFAEDIGRHNCIDKIIGMALYRTIAMERLIVLTSGRVTSEIMFKLQKMKSPVIVSRSAPTDLSVKLSRKWYATLVGFARGRRMNVYSAPERIL